MMATSDDEMRISDLPDLPPNRYSGYVAVDQNDGTKKFSLSGMRNRFFYYNDNVTECRQSKEGFSRKIDRSIGSILADMADSNWNDVPNVGDYWEDQNGNKWLIVDFNYWADLNNNDSHREIDVMLFPALNNTSLIQAYKTQGRADSYASSNIITSINNTIYNDYGSNTINGETIRPHMKYFNYQAISIGSGETYNPNYVTKNNLVAVLPTIEMIFGISSPYSYIDSANNTRQFSLFKQIPIQRYLPEVALNVSKFWLSNVSDITGDTIGRAFSFRKDNGSVALTSQNVSLGCLPVIAFIFD